MKRTIMILGIIVMITIIGFSMASCDLFGPSDPNKVATPTATPGQGTYSTARSVTINCSTSDASIYYTLNGSTPTTSSTLYSGAISISTTTTLKAIAVKEGMTSSDILTAVYTITGLQTQDLLIAGTFGDAMFYAETVAPSAQSITRAIARNIIQDDFKLEGFLEDSGTTYRIEGYYNSEAKTYSLTAASVDIRYSIYGEFNDDGTAEIGKAIVQRKEDTEWITTEIDVDVTSVPPFTADTNGYIMDNLDTGIPAELRGNWRNPKFVGEFGVDSFSLVTAFSMIPVVYDYTAEKWIIEDELALTFIDVKTENGIAECIMSTFFESKYWYSKYGFTMDDEGSLGWGTFFIPIGPNKGESFDNINQVQELTDTYWHSWLVRVNDTRPALLGYITRDPYEAAIGTLITADYHGSESVSYQWKRGLTVVGNSKTFTPTEAGFHFVTVSAPGFIKNTDAFYVEAEFLLPGELILTSQTPDVFYTFQWLNAEYNGPDPVTLEWKKDGEVVETGNNYSYFTPTLAGNYTVTATCDSGRTKTVSFIVELSNLDSPNLYVNGGWFDFDIGTVTARSELSVIYPNNSVEVSYQWNKDGAAIQGATSDKYKPAEPGVYTVTLSALGYNDYISDPITVEPAYNFDPNLITIIAGGGFNNGTELVGTNLFVSYSIPPAGLSYQWNKDGEAIQDATSSDYTPIAIGEYTVTLSALGYNPITSDPITVVLTVDFDPNLITFSKTGGPTSGPEPVGTEIMVMYSINIEGLSYQWNKDGEAIQDATLYRFTPTAVGEYTVTLSAPNYNPITSAPIIIENTNFNSGYIYLYAGNAGYNGDTVIVGTQISVIYSLPPAGLSYQWNKDGEAIQGATFNYYNTTAAGEYTVTLSAPNYNPITSDPIIVTVE